ncbi:unnamed protein product [Nippostrongylus brasiliensis]|uniref:G_PROTEIN_RECEP_F1_2 domain-containing protein n=1 Tax=Nippostrongylus brasiliensis TaxID=27835 RepID=A0A0N4Y838_NIPBR|nr:unnamed protein product [Nippostrongylus brasiliensis]
MDMALSLSQVVMATIIAFDSGFIGFAVLWSAVPTTGYGKYSTFHANTFCSLDWRQGDFDATSSESTDAAHHYIAFLTATCLIFFLIPSSTEAREENGGATPLCCTWAPKGNVAKVGLGCLLSSTLPFLAYSIVCLNPMKSDFNNMSYIVVPVIISRLCPLLNPIFYICSSSAASTNSAESDLTESEAGLL